MSLENELLPKLIKRGKLNGKIYKDFFLDIGSCWGVYSLKFAGIHKNLKILAFDPIKSNIERVALHISLELEN